MKIFTLLVAVFLTASLFSQSPEKMSYQAVIRNASNNLISSKTVGMKISILQGLADGTIVYAETQTPTTNANGLVSIEIGNGTVVSGNFTTIDWTKGPYFLKTETDPAGGTNYTITGTSQLLSVPYALHAKTAESVTGTITEIDPVYSSSIASNITATDTTKWNNKQDKLLTGTGISIIGNTISATVSTTLKIGDSYQGGIIFWLDATGQHGLIAATEDQSSGVVWGTDASETKAVRDGIGAGMYNTERIIYKQNTGNTAAQICANYQGGGYGDWYLPSKAELNMLFQQRTVISGLTNNFYWSSTEDTGNLDKAWRHDFGYNIKTSVIKSAPYRVRAIRAF